MELVTAQKYAFEKFCQGQNLFITGPGGTGKSKLINDFVLHSAKVKNPIQVTALTGCAAILLGNSAKTIHSWSGIKTCRGENTNVIEQVIKNRRIMKNWRSIKTLIIDEVSMMSVKMFDILNAIGKIVKHNDKPFGGIQIVLTGDFYQLPPIETAGDLDSGKFCFESNEWKNTFSYDNHVVLTKIFRQHDECYIKILNEIRKGELCEDNIKLLTSYVNRSYNKEEHNGVSLTKLFPIRNSVDFINNSMFKALEDEAKTYNMLIDTNNIIYSNTKKSIEEEIVQICKKAPDFEIENEINFLKNNTPCVEKLELKIGATVMCTANLDIENGICNGSQGIIIEFVNKVPKVKFTNNVIMLLDYHTWQSEKYPTISISQYPLMLAWAITIHKIQGTTLDMAEMDIGRDVFACGQTYVALSRIRSLEGLYLSGFDPKKIKANTKVKEFYDSIPENDYKITNVFQNFANENKKDIKIIKL